MRAMKMNCTKPKQAGSVLLEALISILIFSIGILGLVGMQATAISSVGDAKYRSSASFLADQMIGTIWATSCTGTWTGGICTPGTPGAAATPDPSLLPCTPCTVANANANIQAWASSVAATLPVGCANCGGSIAISGPVFTVTVSWQLPNKNAAASAVTHTHTAVTYIN